MTTKSKTIVVDFIRHGEPEGGDILRGRINPELTKLGLTQMKVAVSLGEAWQPSASTPDWTEIISSPLKRCQQFAERLSAEMSLPFKVDQDWQEIDYGDWDGMPINEWRKEAAEQFKAFSKDLSALKPPNGETYSNFKERILGALESLSELPDGSHVLVVTHGGVLRVVIPSILGMPFNKSGPLHIPFACFSRMKILLSNPKPSKLLVFHNKGEYPNIDT